jgi:hypothetical protein
MPLLEVPPVAWSSPVLLGPAFEQATRAEKTPLRRVTVRGVKGIARRLLKPQLLEAARSGQSVSERLPS